VTSSWIYFSFS